MTWGSPSTLHARMHYTCARTHACVQGPEMRHYCIARPVQQTKAGLTFLTHCARLAYPFMSFIAHSCTAPQSLVRSFTVLWYCTQAYCSQVEWGRREAQAISFLWPVTVSP